MGAIISPLRSTLSFLACLCLILTEAAIVLGWVCAIDSLLDRCCYKDTHIRSAARPIGILAMGVSISPNVSAIEIVAGSPTAFAAMGRLLQRLLCRCRAAAIRDCVDRSPVPFSKQETRSPRTVLTRRTIGLLRLPDSVFIFTITDGLALIGGWALCDAVAKAVPGLQITANVVAWPVLLMMVGMQFAAMPTIFSIGTKT